MKVNIVLSTYNGAKFLSEQIDSIQAQTFTDWQLLIRDDDSSDKTRDIIVSYMLKDERIKFINEGDHTNLGVINSFYKLITGFIHTNVHLHSEVPVAAFLR